MKIEFTRAEVERILLDYANKLIPYANFDDVHGGSYSSLPATIVVEKTNAAQ
jgi:hypothetical protein